jgi:hypothetical protein
MACQNRASCGQAVDVWRLDPGLALSADVLPSDAEVAIAKVVGKYEYDIRPGGGQRRIERPQEQHQEKH